VRGTPTAYRGMLNLEDAASSPRVQPTFWSSPRSQFELVDSHAAARRDRPATATAAASGTSTPAQADAEGSAVARRMGPLKPHRERGVVNKWIDDKGFGFITVERLRDSIFCHASNVNPAVSLTKDTVVEFEIVPNRQSGRDMAINVTIIQQAPPPVQASLTSWRRQSSQDPIRSRPQVVGTFQSAPVMASRRDNAILDRG